MNDPLGFDLLGAILNANNPPCIGCGAPATVNDDPFKLCGTCDERLTESLQASGFPIVAPVEAGRAA
jgi:hypothetical protein